MVLLGEPLQPVSDNLSNALLLSMAWHRALLNSCFPKEHPVAVPGIAGKEGKGPPGDLMLFSLLSPQFFYNPEAEGMDSRRQ